MHLIGSSLCAEHLLLAGQDNGTGNTAVGKQAYPCPWEVYIPVKEGRQWAGKYTKHTLCALMTSAPKETKQRPAQGGLGEDQLELEVQDSTETF